MHALLERLVEADIRFVLVGGLAVGAWGYVRGTKDVDLVPDPAEENLERLAELLRELDGKVEVEDRLLTADAISTFLRTGDRTLVATKLGPVDVLQGAAPGAVVCGARCAGRRRRSRGFAGACLLSGASAGDEASQRTTS
jgi:hypothetical protein